MEYWIILAIVFVTFWGLISELFTFWILLYQMCLKLSGVTYTVHLCGLGFVLWWVTWGSLQAFGPVVQKESDQDHREKKNNEHCKFFWVCVFLENFIRAGWIHTRKIILKWWLSLNIPHVNKKFSLKQPEVLILHVWLWLPPSPGDSVLLWWDLALNHTKDNT